MTLVVKVQRPLASTEKNPAYLAYNQDKTVMRQVPASAIPKKLFKYGEARVYAKAELSQDGTLMIGERTRNHPW